jgi:cell division protein ZapA
LVGALGNIQVEINGRTFGIGCDDDQEDHIRKLARQFDIHVRNLGQSVGQVGDQRLFLMAGLLLGDENYELRLKLAATEAELARIRDIRPENNENQKRQIENLSLTNTKMQEALNIACKSFDEAANRIESIAEMLDKA